MMCGHTFGPSRSIIERKHLLRSIERFWRGIILNTMSVTSWVDFSRRYATRLGAIIPGDKSPGYIRLPLTRLFLWPARGYPRSTATAADRNETEGRVCRLYDF